MSIAMNAKRNRLHGHIQLIIGPVFSGKTTELLRRVERYKLANRSCSIVQYKQLNSHHHKGLSNREVVRDFGEPICVTKIKDVLQQLSNADIIGIDDGHFFDDIADSADYLAECGKIVLVAALDGNFLRKRFEPVMQLFPRCENICKLSAVCINCGNDAPFSCISADVVEQHCQHSAPQYSALCRRCYFVAQEELCTGRGFGPDCHDRHLSYEGRIELIFGPMFSGKTTEMLRRRTRHTLASSTCKVVKYAGDTRYDSCKVTTHDQLMQDAISARRIGDIFEILTEYEVILIDEGQFFPDIAVCCELLANLGKLVIVASLDGDFNRNEFQSKVLDLCSLAEDVVKLKAVCVECGNDAAFTSRLTAEKEQELIGGKEMYRAMCRYCFMRKCSEEDPDSKSGRYPLHDVN